MPNKTKGTIERENCPTAPDRIEAMRTGRIIRDWPLRWIRAVSVRQSITGGFVKHRDESAESPEVQKSRSLEGPESRERGQFKPRGCFIVLSTPDLCPDQG